MSRDPFEDGDPAVVPRRTQGLDSAQSDQPLRVTFGQLCELRCELTVSSRLDRFDGSRAHVPSLISKCRSQSARSVGTADSFQGFGGAEADVHANVRPNKLR